MLHRLRQPILPRSPPVHAFILTFSPEFSLPLQLNFDPTVGGDRDPLEEISDNGVDDTDSTRDPSAANQKLENATERRRDELHRASPSGNGSLVSPSSSSSSSSASPSAPCIPCAKPALDRKTALYFGNRFFHDACAFMIGIHRILLIFAALNSFSTLFLCSLILAKESVCPCFKPRNLIPSTVE